ncbi:MAG: hypothetical protein K7J15_02710 [Candidatus Regiella insecticola]|nr:hypothetical protein [Candidatus Regiella insecticola]
MRECDGEISKTTTMNINESSRKIGDDIDEKEKEKEKEKEREREVVGCSVFWRREKS